MSERGSRKGFPPDANSFMDLLRPIGGISAEPTDADNLDSEYLDPIVSPQELQDLVDRFGEDLTIWPSEIRVPAEQLLDSSVEARSIIAQARRLRQQLRTLGPKAPHCIVDRIVAVALEIDPPMDDDCRLPN